RLASFGARGLLEAHLAELGLRLVAVAVTIVHRTNATPLTFDLEPAHQSSHLRVTWYEPHSPALTLATHLALGGGVERFAVTSQDRNEELDHRMQLRSRAHVDLPCLALLRQSERRAFESELGLDRFVHEASERTRPQVDQAALVLQRHREERHRLFLFEVERHRLDLGELAEGRLHAGRLRSRSGLARVRARR